MPWQRMALFVSRALRIPQAPRLLAPPSSRPPLVPLSPISTPYARQNTGPLLTTTNVQLISYVILPILSIHVPLSPVAP